MTKSFLLTILFLSVSVIYSGNCTNVINKPFLFPLLSNTNTNVIATPPATITIDVSGVSKYTIGGTLTLLGGTNTVVLQNNGSDNLSLTTNGIFTFATPLAGGVTYSVTVVTQPSGQNCILTNPGGTLTFANITSVTVTCTGNANGSLSSGTIINALPTLGGVGVTTFVGSPCAPNAVCATGIPGFVDSATLANVRFNAPSAITTDGYNLYIADRNNNAIRKVVIATGDTTTLAGSTAGASGNINDTGTAARFNSPRGITTDGVSLFVSDSGNNSIRKVNISSGLVTTIISAGLDTPRGMTVYNNNLYIADSVTDNLYQFNLSTLVLTSVISAGLNSPRGIILLGNDIYISDFNSHNLLKTTVGTWTLSTFATALSNPDGITTDGTNLFVLSEGTDQLKKITVPAMVVTTIAGDGTNGYINNSTSMSARFRNPRGITSDGASVYVVDRGNHTIRKVE